MGYREDIMDGRTALGIELGSTRIKAVLVNDRNEIIAQGDHSWENQLVDGIWTYSLKAIWGGLQDAYAQLAANVNRQYGTDLTTLGAMGFSAMMHGYMAFNDKDELLVPFRTWRNTMTEEASLKLTEAFGFHIPQRWSIAHLYQAILKGEEHVKDVAFFTTLAGYIHWQLTGEKVLGVGEASGMFPIDSNTKQFDTKMIETFDAMVADKGFPWKLAEILPGVKVAGEHAGVLTAEGAKKLDPTGTLQPGVPLCPPEGDAGTGMTATNSVRVRTGNVSAGTSVFSMIVTEKPLSKAYEEIDMVTTPTGEPVAMVHCNNCTSDLNAWVDLFKETLDLFGVDVPMNDLYGKLYNKALEGDADCGGLLAYNYFSGEHVTGFEEGRPLFVRKPDAAFTLSNFMRTHLYTSLGALKTGMDILLKEEKVAIDRITGHGGLFKTKGVGQSILAAACNTPIAVMETAGEGGAWGMAILANYMISGEKLPLDVYLEQEVFADAACEIEEPKEEMVAGFEAFMENYKAGLAVERAAVDHLW
ncbi:MAG: xylulokinase [Oscillospiraceae bacterium]